MDGAALLLALGVAGVRIGWQPMPDDRAKYEYVVHVDQRVADHLATEELSLGDFVLSGGEPAALAIIDAVVRLLPGAMSDMDSARGDSFYDGRGISAQCQSGSGLKAVLDQEGKAEGRHGAAGRADGWRGKPQSQGGTPKPGPVGRSVIV